MSVLLPLLLAAQASSQTPPEKWSVLAPTENCAATPAANTDIVVCGRAQGSRLPLPDERPPPDRPRPAIPDQSGMVSGEGQGSVPCSAMLRGCTVGVGPPPALVNAAVTLAKDTAGAIGRAFTKQPDRSKRIPIPLDDDGPKGTLLP